jgi:hypothetical protein
MSEAKDNSELIFVFCGFSACCILHTDSLDRSLTFLVFYHVEFLVSSATPSVTFMHLFAIFNSLPSHILSRVSLQSSNMLRYYFCNKVTTHPFELLANFFGLGAFSTISCNFPRSWYPSILAFIKFSHVEHLPFCLQ